MHAQATSVEPHADYSHLLAWRHGTTRAILDIGDEWELPADELDDPDDEPPELRAGHDLEHEIAESSADRESRLLAHAARVRTELFGPAGVTSDTRGDQRGIPRPVGDLATGLVYPSTSEAAEFVGLRSHHVKNAIDRAGDAAGRRWAWADESHVNAIRLPAETVRWLAAIGMTPRMVQFGKPDTGVVGLPPLDELVIDGGPPPATRPQGNGGGPRPCKTREAVGGRISDGTSDNVRAPASIAGTRVTEGPKNMPRRRTAQSGNPAPPQVLSPTPATSGGNADPLALPPVADDLRIADEVIEGLAKLNGELETRIAKAEAQNIELARSIIQLAPSRAKRERWTQLRDSLNARRQASLAAAGQPTAHAAVPASTPAKPAKRAKKRKRQVARLPRQDTGALAGPGAVQQQVPQAQPELAAVA